MIKNILRIIILILLINFIKFIERINIANEMMNEFYLTLNESVIYAESEEYLLRFDYQKINKTLNNLYKNYETTLIKNSEISFDVEIKIEYFIFSKTIKENFCIRKGDLYEKFI